MARMRQFLVCRLMNPGLNNMKALNLRLRKLSSPPRIVKLITLRNMSIKTMNLPCRN